jgi:hypothetical protein
MFYFRITAAPLVLRADTYCARFDLIVQNDLPAHDRRDAIGQWQSSLTRNAGGCHQIDQSSQPSPTTVRR